MTDTIDYRPCMTPGFAIGRVTVRSLAREWEHDPHEAETIAGLVERFLSDRWQLREFTREFLTGRSAP